MKSGWTGKKLTSAVKLLTDAATTPGITGDDRDLLRIAAKNKVAE